MSSEDDFFDKDPQPSYIDLIEKKESLKGYKIIQEIESLKTTHYIFKQNFINLIEKINDFEGEIEIWFVENRDDLRQTQIEILRLLHNYTSSVLTLIDHTRNFRNKIIEKNLEKDFESEINKLALNDVVHFTKLLRQYFQHYTLPITNAHFFVENPSGTREQRFPKTTIQLDVKELLKWRRWNEPSKRYIKQFDENIEVKVFCQEYYNLIEQFYETFYKIVLKAYEPEIRDLVMFEERVDKLYPRLSKN